MSANARALDKRWAWAGAWACAGISFSSRSPRSGHAQAQAQARLFLTAACALATACATVEATVPESRDRGDPLPAAKPALDRFPDAAAVVLYARDGTKVSFSGGGEFATTLEVHRVYAIASEDAFELANLRIVVPPRSRLTRLTARHRTPAGEIEYLNPRDVIVDESDGSGDEDADQTASARYYRFSGIGVGSVLEWEYVIETAWFDGDGELRPPAEYPVLRYEGFVEAPRELVLAARAYNAPPAVETPAEEGWARYTLDVYDFRVPPEKEKFSPDPSFTVPSLAWRVTRFEPRYAGRPIMSVPMLGEWKDVFSRWAYATYMSGRSVLAGFDVQLDVSGCPDAPCRVQRALDLVERMTAYDGVGDWYVSRRATEMVQSREATAFERAVLLKHLLETAQVSCMLGGYTAPYTHRVDKGFPSLEQLNRPIVYLPPQGGSRDPLWVDPTCTACRAGEVGDEALGAIATLMRFDGYDRFGRPNVETYGTEITGRPFPRSQLIQLHVAQVLPGGEVQLEHRDERWGSEAIEHCRASPREQGDPAEQLSQVSATARVSERLQPRCETQRAYAVEGYRAVLPDHALVDGSTLYVPLTLLEPDWMSVLADRERLTPVAFTRSQRREYRVELKVPSGWKLSGAKPAERVDAPGLSALFSVRPSATGADVLLSIDVTPGVYEAGRYPELRKVAEFVRGARTRAIKFVRR